MATEKLSPTKQRWWLRFSLRSFFIVFTGVAFLLLFWVLRIEKERRAVKQIEEVGGSVFFEHEVDYASQEFETRYSKFIDSLFVMGKFSNVSIVSFPDPQVSGGFDLVTKKTITKETLKVISSLSTITGLKFYDYPLKLENLHYLSSLKSLKTLQFYCSPDTQSSDCIALDHLGEIASLQGLAIGGLPDVRGKLGFLEDLSNLRTLDILTINLGLDDLKAIGTLTQLDQLVLSGISNCESGLYHLANLSKLSHLDLGTEAIRSNSFNQFKSLKNLRYLKFCPAKIDDALIVFLESLPNLRYLELSCNQVDEQGLQKLHAALPECHITPASDMNSEEFWEEEGVKGGFAGQRGREL